MRSRATTPLLDMVRAGERDFTGYVFDPENPDQRYVVEVCADGQPLALLRADRFVRRLLDLGCGDGCYGFTFQPSARQLQGRVLLHARLANTDIAVGEPIDLKVDAAQLVVPIAGRVEWVGGLRLVGHVRPQEHRFPSVIRVYEGLDLLAEVTPRQWMSSERVANPTEHPFDVALPMDLADGRVHELRIESALGTELEGSPLFVLAFEDGLVRYLESNGGPIGEAQRAKWFERLFPMSLPFSSYGEWRARFPTEPAEPAHEIPVRVVVIGSDGDGSEAFERMAEQTHAAWSGAFVTSREADGGFARADLEEALETDRDGEEIAILTTGDAQLHPDAIAKLARSLRDSPQASAACCDLVVHDDDGEKPLFFGSFDYERMLEQGYAAHLFAVRIDDLDLERTESLSLPRLLLSLFDQPGSDIHGKVVHLPDCLARMPGKVLRKSEPLKLAMADHLAARQVPAKLSLGHEALFPQVRVGRLCEASQTVSIVIPTRDRPELLEACVESVRAQTRHIRYEIVVVDNGSIDPKAQAFLNGFAKAGHGVVIRAPGPFNYSRLNNRGVAAAGGSFVCFLNNDTEVLDPDWLLELASRLAEPSTGAVTPVLTWPNGMVQHGGVVLGPNFSVAHAFNDCSREDAGYGDLLRSAHETSAATGACLMMRRADFLSLGGFDETAFPVLFNDVDLCLRLRAQHKRIVVTPHTRLLHHEAASRGQDESAQQVSRFRRESNLLRQRWGTVLADDPCYNPNLALDIHPFSALAWPPRARSVR
jgi:GT2 family glycosyltransferase